MATVYDVHPEKLIKATAKDLKENVKLERPQWALYVKTGVTKESPPEDADWWWTRAAAVLRRIYVDGPVGVQRLRTQYGGRKHRGVKPEEFRRGSGKILRHALQKFDELGYTVKTENKKGRVITPKGRAYLDNLAASVAKQ
ncbi:30S ribosomal protein S19e [uncultured archaeon]|nr:30S ribosomal protein S19e [uncultured archaeon]